MYIILFVMKIKEDNMVHLLCLKFLKKQRNQNLMKKMLKKIVKKVIMKVQGKVQIVNRGK